MISFRSISNSGNIFNQFVKQGSCISEQNNEGLKNKATSQKDCINIPNELIGRSQVIKINPKFPHELELSDKDNDFISELSSDMYGFIDSSNEFWVHSTKPTKDGTPKVIMGDGAIPNGSSRYDFVKELINDKTPAFQIAGNDIYDGNKLITVVKNSETGKMTMYTCDSKQCYPKIIDDDISIKKLTSAILENLIAVQGVTVWNCK